MKEKKLYESPEFEDTLILNDVIVMSSPIDGGANGGGNLDEDEFGNIWQG